MPLRLSSRLAAAALVLLGVCTLLNAADTPMHVDGVRLGAGVVFALGGVVLAGAFLVVPWPQLPRLWFLASGAALFCFVLAQGWATGYYESAFGPAVQAAEFLIVATLVGLTQRRGVPTLFALFMCAAFLISSAAVSVVAVLIIGAIFGTPLCVAQGEVMAWSVNEFVAGRDLDRRRVGDLERLSRSLAALRHGAGSEDAATTIAALAQDLLDGAHASVVVRRAGMAPATMVDELALGTRRAEVEDALARCTVEDVALPDGSSVLIVPLVADGDLIGVLSVRGATKEPFDEFAKELAALLAAESAGVLAQLVRIELLSAESRADPLTQVGNRRYADHLLGAMRAGDGLLIVDVDRFKAVNDTHGHTRGDDLLRELAAFLRSSLRDDSCIARYGGDEFVVVLEQAGDEVGRVAERLVDGWGADRRLTTFTVGCAVHDGGAPADTFRRADEALYRAKSTPSSQHGS